MPGRKGALAGIFLATEASRRCGSDCARETTHRTTQLTDKYPDHTRVVYQVSMIICTLAYAASPPSARQTRTSLR